MYKAIFVTNRTDEQPSTVYVFDDVNGLITHAYKDFDYAYRKDPAGHFTSIYGHKLKKTYSWNREDTDVFESDVSRETRVLTDLYLDSDDVSTGHNVGTIDIETSSVGGFPNIELANREITCIGFHNQITDEYIQFLYDPRERLKDRQKDNVTLLTFSTERDMLYTFLSWYTDQKFTILTGWNISGFDITYVYRRLCTILSEDDANMLSPIGLIKWSNMRERYQIAGVNILDYLEMYKKFILDPRPNYRLDTIGKIEVNINKVDLGMTIDDIYDTDIEKFLEYNLVDIKIVVELDKKRKLIDLAKNICHVGHVQYEDFLYSSKFIDGTILTYLHRKGIICPNKPIDGQEQMQQKSDDGEEGFEGAYVKDPTPGLYHWVYSLDLQSLYPSIIMSLNISPETKIGKVYNWNVEQHLSNQIEVYEVEAQQEKFKFKKEEFVAFMDKMNFSLSSNGILYLLDRRGIIPEILDKWFDQRTEFKNLMKKYKKEGNKEKADYYDKRQAVQKIFLNSIYGVLGLPIFRFYDLDNAAAVSVSGQDVIKSTMKMINTRYVKKTGVEKDYCTYGDTDSTYFSALDYSPDANKQLTIELAREMEMYVNKGYNWLAPNAFFVKEGHRFVIKGETVAQTAFWTRKKRYAMWKVFDLETNLDEDKVKVTGLDSVRSSFPPAFGKFMITMVEDILHSISKDDADKKVLTFHEHIGTLQPSEIARNTSIQNLTKYEEKGNTSLLRFKSGTTMHAKASLIYNRYLISKGLDKKHALIKSGDKIKYVYVRQNPLQIEVIAFKGYDDPKEIIEFINRYVDYEMMFDKELKGKLEDFYSAMKWGRIPTEINQLAGNFFDF